MAPTRRARTVPVQPSVTPPTVVRATRSRVARGEATLVQPLAAPVRNPILVTRTKEERKKDRLEKKAATAERNYNQRIEQANEARARSVKNKAKAETASAREKRRLLKLAEKQEQRAKLLMDPETQKRLAEQHQQARAELTRARREFEDIHDGPVIFEEVATFDHGELNLVKGEFRVSSHVAGFLNGEKIVTNLRSRLTAKQRGRVASVMSKRNNNDAQVSETTGMIAAIVHNCYERVKSYLSKNAHPNDFVSIMFGNSEPANIQVRKLTLEFFTNISASTIQSANNHGTLDAIQFSMTIKKANTGGKSGRVSSITDPTEIAKKKSIITINNQHDKLCLLYALELIKQYDACDASRIAAQENANTDTVAEAAYQKARLKKFLKDNREFGCLHTRAFGKQVLNTAVELDFSPDEELGLGHLNLLEQHYHAYIHVYTSLNRLITSASLVEDRNNEDGFEPRFSNHWYVQYDENTRHFNAITNYTAAMGLDRNQWCHVCGQTATPDHAKFTCPYLSKRACRSCRSETDHYAEWQTTNAVNGFRSKMIPCEKCNRKFPTSTCFDNHLPTCGTVVRCDNPECGKLLKGKEVTTHDCSKIKCDNCGEEYKTTDEHLCYIKPMKPKPARPLSTIMFADYETLPLNAQRRKVLKMDDQGKPFKVDKQGNPSAKGTFATEYKTRWFHEVHYVVIKTMREEIDPTTQKVKYVVDKSWEFEGENALTDSTTFLMHPDHHEYTVYFHNGSGFDFSFLYRELVNERGYAPSVIKSGSKIKSMDVAPVNPNSNKKHAKPLVHFRDSLLHFMSGLRRLPTTFGFSNEVIKGDFPHRFIVQKDTPEETLEATLNYVGPPPPLEDYDPNRKSTGEKAALTAWYKTDVAPLTTWSYRDEMKKYCHADVEVLGKAWCIYRASSLASAREGEHEMDPTNYITAAGFALAEFMTNHMQEKTIAYIPQHGFKERCSALERDWLDNLGIPGLERQYKITVDEKTYIVDAIDHKTNTIYEFNGSYWHGGCAQCKHAGEEAKARRKRTQNRKRQLESLGYNVKSQCECTYIPSTAYLTRSQESMPFHVRDAFAGGRTEAFKHMATTRRNNTKLTEDDIDNIIQAANQGGDINKLLEGVERIYYADVTSLYPTVNKKDVYPMHHPKILHRADINWTPGTPFRTGIIGEDGTDALYKGVLRVKVRAPKDLLIPVLGQKMMTTNGYFKFMFHTCEKCVVENTKTSCKHTDEERTFITKVPHLELLKALDMGYELLDIYDVDHFEHWSRGMFASYVNKFIKIKTECGVPDHWTASKRQKVTDEFLEREDVQLDIDNMEDNPGKKQIAKTMCNSLWGRFGMNSDHPRTKIVRDIDELRAIKQRDLQGLITNVTYEPLDEEGNSWSVTWHTPGLHQLEDRKSNVYIALFTTSQARLRLYSGLEAVGFENVIYCDTDSIMFTSDVPIKEVSDKLPISEFLGDFKDELSDSVTSGGFIYDIGIGGPKSYSYRACVPDGKGGWKKKGDFKMKGFSMNAENSKVFTHDVLKAIVENRDDDKLNRITLKNQFQIRRTQDLRVYHEEGEKTFAFDSNKRIILDDEHTVPYGYAL